jgi:hypothetical protein
MHVLYFGSGQQGSRLSQNGGDESREVFFTCLSTQEHIRLSLCSEVVGPTSEKTRRWGTAPSSGIENPSMAGVCKLQNAQNDQALWRREWSVSLTLSNTALLKQVKVQVGSLVSYNIPYGELFWHVCGWSHTAFLSVIQWCRFYDMRQGIINNPIFF